MVRWRSRALGRQGVCRHAQAHPGYTDWCNLEKLWSTHQNFLLGTTNLELLWPAAGGLDEGVTPNATEPGFPLVRQPSGKPYYIVVHLFSGRRRSEDFHDAAAPYGGTWGSVAMRGMDTGWAPCETCRWSSSWAVAKTTQDGSSALGSTPPEYAWAQAATSWHSAASFYFMAHTTPHHQRGHLHVWAFLEAQTGELGLHPMQLIHRLPVVKLWCIRQCQWGASASSPRACWLVGPLFWWRASKVGRLSPLRFLNLPSAKCLMANFVRKL